MRPKSESRRIEPLLVVVVALVWAGLVAVWVERLDGQAQDDFYVTYRYARSLAEGEGLVYNPGDRVFGLSEPGLGLLLGGLHRVTGSSIPRLGSVVFGASLWALAVLVLAASISRGRGPEALLAGTVLLSWSFVWTNHGSGAPLMLALLVGAAGLTGWRDRGRVLAVGGGVLAGLAVWVRPDAAAGVGLLALLLLREERREERREDRREGRRRVVAFGVGAGAVAGAGALAAWGYFGSVLPLTLEAKRTMVEGFLPGYGPAEFWSEAAGGFRRHSGMGTWPLLVLGLAGLVPLWRRAGRPGRLLVLFAAAVAAAYSVLGVPRFSWYLLPVGVALTYGFAFGVGETARRVGRWISPSGRMPGEERRYARKAITLAVALLLALPVALPLAARSLHWSRAFDGYGRLRAYREAGEWIRTHTAEGTSVASIEIGVLGYTSRRPIVDLLGLVTPESLPWVARHDLPGAYLARPTDLVVVRRPGRMEAFLRRAWFRESFVELRRFGYGGGLSVVIVFGRRPDSTLPPPLPSPGRAGPG